METASGFRVERPQEVLFGYLHEEYDLYDFSTC
jgi:hypothetical protein